MRLTEPTRRAAFGLSGGVRLKTLLVAAVAGKVRVAGQPETALLFRFPVIPHAVNRTYPQELRPACPAASG
jgi:hypothetical protein